MGNFGYEHDTEAALTWCFIDESMTQAKGRVRLPQGAF